MATATAGETLVAITRVSGFGTLYTVPAGTYARVEVIRAQAGSSQSLGIQYGSISVTYAAGIDTFDFGLASGSYDSDGVGGTGIKERITMLAGDDLVTSSTGGGSQVFAAVIYTYLAP